METVTELTVTLLTIKELLDKYAPNLIEKIEKLSDEGKIKTDGAIDEITNRVKKDIMPLDFARIIEEVQRVDAIEENKIIDNLLRAGGFSHQDALVGDVFGFEGEDYKSGTDTMHRWIMAFACGVTEVAINEQDVHSIDATDEEILRDEKRAFDARNRYNAKVTDTSKQRVAKTTGTWSTTQQAKHETLKRIYIHINSYGVNRDDAYFVFKSFSEFNKLIENPSNPCYVETDDLKKTVEYFKNDVLGKGIENHPRLFGALCIVYSKFLSNKEKRAFTVWLEDSSQSGYKFYNLNFWSQRVQHTRNMEQTTIRILCAYNQWRRNQLKENVIEITDLKDLLNVMNIETHHFVEDSIISQIPLKYDPVVATKEDDDFSSIDETLEMD